VAKNASTKTRRATKPANAAKPAKARKAKASLKLKNFSPEALRAIKALRGVYAPKMPAKLRGPNAAAIRRAVRDHFLG
jgi:hypothetical protein